MLSFVCNASCSVTKPNLSANGAIASSEKIKVTPSGQFAIQEIIAIGTQIRSKFRGPVKSLAKIFRLKLKINYRKFILYIILKPSMKVGSFTSSSTVLFVFNIGPDSMEAESGATPDVLVSIQLLMGIARIDGSLIMLWYLYDEDLILACTRHQSIIILLWEAKRQSLYRINFKM